MFAVKTLSTRIVQRMTSVSALRCLSSYPPHQIVGMPSLSPTMSSGTIGKWNIKVGDKISAGISMADVETDKASMAFEAQDDFIVAKLLVDNGAEVKVGDPIMVTVEEGVDVSAFANFTVAATPAAPVAPPAAPKPVAAPAPVAAPVVAKPAAPVAAPKPAAPTPVAAPKPVAAPAAPSSVAKVSRAQPGTEGPLTSILAQDHQAYIAKYGRSGQNPLRVKVEKSDKADKKK